MAAEKLTALAKDEEMRRLTSDAAVNIGHGVLKGLGVIETNPDNGSTTIHTGSISEFLSGTRREKAIKAIKVGVPAVARELIRSGDQIATQGRKVISEAKPAKSEAVGHEEVAITGIDYAQAEQDGAILAEEAEAYLREQSPANPIAPTAAEKPDLGKTVPFKPSEIPQGDTTLDFRRRPEDLGWQVPSDFSNN